MKEQEQTPFESIRASFVIDDDKLRLVSISDRTSFKKVLMQLHFRISLRSPRRDEWKAAAALVASNSSSTDARFSKQTMAQPDCKAKSGVCG